MESAGIIKYTWSQLKLYINDVLLRVDHTPVTCVWGSALGQTPKVIKAVVIYLGVAL
jgi:hypothetical protein